MGGELLAEYPANGLPTSPQKEYGYRNGQLLVQVIGGASGGAAPSFHDNPLQAGVTPVYALHITELRDAINQVRISRGMVAAFWVETVSSGVGIKAAHIQEMRDRLDQAIRAPTVAYTAELKTGKQIKAAHIQELRNRVTAALSALSIQWLVTDQLGTPRMILDQTGTLAGVSRHDYLPFGEEILSSTGVRNTVPGYFGSDVRQKFTQKERDDETGLDYFGARYYSSMQGRFTSVDPENAGARESDPRSWNAYSYAGGNPVLYSDPDGREYLVCGPDGKNCTTVSDEQFWAERKAFEKTGNTYTGSRDFYENGQVKNADGGVVASYVQISIDDRAGQYIFAIRGAVNPIPMATAQFFGISLATGAIGGAAVYALTPYLAPAVTTLGLRAATVLPAVPSALDKLRNLGISLEQANAIVQSPTSQKLIDNANGGNINVIQEVGGKLVRVTLDPTGQRIISAGIVRANQITNGIANGRFVKK
jgi:RHS repeat-associated protein